VSCSDIEKSLGVATPPLIDLIREHPNASLYDAAQRLIQTHSRRLPLLDNDSKTGHQVNFAINRYLYSHRLCPHAISSPQVRSPLRVKRRIYFVLGP
jgi:hypothetical protein